MHIGEPQQAVSVLPECEDSLLSTLGCFRLTPFGLGCGQLQLANPLQVDVLTSNPKVMGVLHGEPALGRAANSLGKAQRHLRGDPTGALQDAAEGGRRDIELFRELSTTDAIGLKVDLGDELTGVGRVVHSH